MNRYRFTARQRQVLEQVCAGKTNKQIARMLNIAEATVKVYLTEVFRKMDVHTRAEAIVKIMRGG